MAGWTWSGQRWSLGGVEVAGWTWSGQRRSLGQARCRLDLEWAEVVSGGGGGGGSCCEWEHYSLLKKKKLQSKRPIKYITRSNSDGFYDAY